MLPGVAAAEASNEPYVLDCAAQHLKDGRFNINIEVVVSEGKASIESLAVGDDASESESEIPKKELQDFTQCILPLLTNEKIEFEEH